MTCRIKIVYLYKHLVDKQDIIKNECLESKFLQLV